MIYGVVALAFFISLVLSHKLLRPGSIFYTLDRPNQRSLHSRPMPRGGGLGIAAAIYLAGGIAMVLGGAIHFPFFPAVAGVALVAVSYWDDRNHVRIGYRLGVHFAAAVILVYDGSLLAAVDLPGVSLPLTLSNVAGAVVTTLCIVWMVNLYNFMDGMDGFAAGMAVIGFGSFAILSWGRGDVGFTTLSLVICAAAAGFLVLNFPPARIFMGDAGSSLLGFLAAALTLWAARADIFPFWAALLVFSPFIVDATVTLALRLLRREQIWQAHKSHFYQRLVQMGWGHRRTLMWELALMAGCAGSAIFAVRVRPDLQQSLLLAWTIAYAALMGFVIWLERNPKRTLGP